MYTLSILFSHDKKRVLMCWHRKQEAYNFIGGKVRDMEPELDASYREVEEETGITKDDVELYFVRRESVTSMAYNKDYGHTWSMYVTTGVLNKTVELRDGENQLRWIHIVQFRTIIDNTFGFGNCYNFLLEAIEVLKKKGFIIGEDIF